MRHTRFRRFDGRAERPGNVFLQADGDNDKKVSSCPTDNEPSSKADRNPLKSLIRTCYPVIDVGYVIPRGRQPRCLHFM